MRQVAVVGFAADTSFESGGRSDAELLGPVVDAACAASGVTPDDIGVICSASSEFLTGVVGTVMGAFDVLPGWPPRSHSHLEGEGAFALFEAWARLRAGEADAALVCAYSRPLADDMASVLTQQLDPYVVSPLAARPVHLAALQARAMIDSGRYGEPDFSEVVSERRGGAGVAELMSMPYVAPPLRALDCSSVCFGAAAMVLAVDALAHDALDGSGRRPAWITAMAQRMERHQLGARDLTASRSIRAAATDVGVVGAALDVLEVHAPFSHQELLAVEAVGASKVGAVNPSGGALPLDPVMTTGLIRIGSAARSVIDGEARSAVGHATSGPCLQHNVLCAMSSSPVPEERRP